MYNAIRWSEALFGRGEDSFPFWLLTIRVNVIVFVVCSLGVVAWNLSHAPLRRALEAKLEVGTALLLTMLGGWLRFAVAGANLMDFGGIAYSRLLLGYKGYFATAQFFSPLYQLTVRDIEHAILFNRVAGTLTIPLVYILCRRLQGLSIHRSMMPPGASPLANGGRPFRGYLAKPTDKSGPEPRMGRPSRARGEAPGDFGGFSNGRSRKNRHSLQERVSLLAPTAAFIVAVYPLHILFSASDALAIFTGFLAASSYVLLAGAAARGASAPPAWSAWIAGLSYLGGCTGLTLLTQVRYENVLLIVPAVLGLLGRRAAQFWRPLLSSVCVAAAFLAIYGYEAVTSGISYAEPVQPWRNLDLVIQHVALNPLMAIPVLFSGTLAIALYRGVWFGLSALLPWLVAFTLTVLASGDGHGAARIYANWLILILPLAGYGFALLLSAPRRAANAVAAAGLLYLGAQPLLMRDGLTVRYLEMAENDRFKALVTALPPSVTSIIVPDNELMWRQSHTSWEIYEKYAMILAGSGEAARQRTLVRLTDFLEHPERTSCANGACVFFFGLPCMEHDMYLYTPDQCRELLRTHGVAVVDETTVVAAPFVHCSIYTGRMRERFCEPATTPQRFVAYRVEQ